MIKIPKPISTTPPITRRKTAPAHIRHLGHELANQLTVINLCCGKIRAHLPFAVEAANAAEFNQIEKTVEECVRLLQQVEQLHQTRVASLPVTRRKHSELTSPSVGNVYPLFDTLQPPHTQD